MEPLNLCQATIGLSGHATRCASNSPAQSDPHDERAYAVSDRDFEDVSGTYPRSLMSGRMSGLMSGLMVILFPRSPM